MNTQLKSLLKNRSFIMILTGQGISNLGDAFQFIAATTMLVKLTGSGLSAILGIIVSQIPSLILSPFAGYLGDRLKIKYVCVIIDFIRSIITLFFIGAHSPLKFYTLMFAISMLDIIYNPAKRKLITCIVSESELLMTNSLLTGVSGIAFLIGPACAGIAVVKFGADIAFYINSFTYIFSAFILFILKSRNLNVNSNNKKDKSGNSGVINEIKKGFKYFKSVPEIKDIIIISTVICSTASAINIAFFPFVFDTLRISNKEWGIMISVFNGTNFLAMLLSFLFSKNLNKKMNLYIIISVILTSWIWFFYSIVNELHIILALQFFEGTILAFCGILLGTRLQSLTNKTYLARVMSIGDIISNTGRIMGVALAYLMLGYFSESSVFLLNSALLFAFIFYKIVKG
ncbi:MAG: MFS transporter [Bacillota bacterium]|nr:MFS transporter [Bacillota bacterium]